MKILYRVSLIFSVCCIGFLAGFMAKSMMETKNNRNLLQNTVVSEPWRESVEPPATVTEKESTADVPVDAVKEAVVSEDTDYVLEEYDLVDKQAEMIAMSLPKEYIGLTRAELEEHVSRYESDPSESDVANGFLSMSLISFSPERVVVRKAYNLPRREDETGFYLVVENNRIVGYKADMKTRFMDTGLFLSDLPEETKQEIIQMKYMADEEELYHFLESHSS